MPIEITMPKLTDTMVDATLAKWLKKEGDVVKPGDMIAEVETDKATQELETFESGTLARIVVPEGGKMPVGALIAVIAKPGEDVAAVAAGVQGVGGRGGEATERRSDGATKVELGEEVETAVEDFQEGAEAAAVQTGRVRVSPLARKIAEQKGVDLNLVVGTGPEGRIVKRDVLEAAIRGAGGGVRTAAMPVRKAPVVSAGATERRSDEATKVVAKLEDRTIKLSNMRQTIARRLQQSKQTIPHFYVTIEVQMDRLLALRQEVNAHLAPEKLSVTDFITRGVAVALGRVPEVNASFTDTAIVLHGSVDLGIAVALEDGLVVPVLRGAQNKSVRQISAEIKNLAELARSKKLKAQDMVGSTFTISNLGMYGVKEFAAIINPPESAILAVGGTAWQAVVKDGAVVPAQVMSLTLSADHRAVDGAMGAKFLSELKGVLENPVAMLF